MTDLVNIAFIGAGAFVSGNHLPNAHRNPRLNIHAIADLDEKRLASHKQDYQPAYVTTDYHDVLRDEKVTLVVVGTRHDVRLPVIRDCAEAGKSVYVEKPMASSAAEAGEIVRIVRANGIKLQVGFNRRFAPAMKALKAATTRMSRIDSLYLRAIEERALWPDHFFEPDMGGTMGAEAYHFLDLASHLAGSEPVEIYARGDELISPVIMLTFTNGAVATIFVGVQGSAGHPKEHIEVFGMGSTATLDHFVDLKVSGVEGVTDQTFPLKLDTQPDIFNDLPAFESLYQKYHYWRDHIPPEDYAKRHYYTSQPQVDKGHYAALDDFATAVTEDRPNMSNEHDGARAAAMEEKAFEAIRTGKTIRISVEDYGIPA